MEKVRPEGREAGLGHAQMPRWQDAMERPCSRRKTTQDDTAVVNLSPECSEGSLKNLIVVDWVGL